MLRHLPLGRAVVLAVLLAMPSESLARHHGGGWHGAGGHAYRSAYAGGYRSWSGYAGYRAPYGYRSYGGYPYYARYVGYPRYYGYPGYYGVAFRPLIVPVPIFVPVAYPPPPALRHPRCSNVPTVRSSRQEPTVTCSPSLPHRNRRLRRKLWSRCRHPSGADDQGRCYVTPSADVRPKKLRRGSS